MHSDHVSPSPSHENTVRLVRELDALKRRGSNVLVVGPHAAHRHACVQFLGDSDFDRRYRLFVTTDVENVTPYPQSGPSDGSSRVIDVRTTEDTERSAAAQPVVDPQPLPSRTDDDGSLEAIVVDLVESIDEVDTAVDGLEPAELRVCLDSLSPILREHDDEVVFRFLHLLTHRVRAVNGMGHVHWAVDPDDRRVGLFTPLFDAVVELRIDAGGIDQRWYLPETRLTTDWMVLASDADR